MKLFWIFFFPGVLCQKFFHPVILVPGDGGSQLEVKLNKPKVVSDICMKKSTEWSTLWLADYNLLPGAINCWVDNMILKYDAKTRTTKNNDGVDIRVPGFGNTNTVEFLGDGKFAGEETVMYFHPIAEALVELGYVRGKNLLGAPYDFRKAANEQKVYFEELTKLIEDSYLQNGNKSVILITHSMGSTMSLYLLNQKSLAWKSKHIRAQISIAGVWAGTVRAMKVFAVGDNLGSFWVSEKALRKQQRSTPSLAWLMPNPNFWDSKEILLQSPEIDITTENFQEFYNYLNETDGLEMWKDTKDLIKNLEAPQVELFCLYSTGVETVEQMVYYKFPNNHPVLIKGDGDGTVNLRSLEAFKKWTNVQKAPIRFKSFKRVDHLEILKDKRVVKEVKQIVKQILEKF